MTKSTTGIDGLIVKSSLTPEIADKIAKAAEEMAAKQKDCGEKTGHRNANSHIAGPPMRVYYECNGCGYLGDRPLNDKENLDYRRLLDTTMTI